MKMSSLGPISWREQMIINWRSWQPAFSHGMLAQLHWSPLKPYNKNEVQGQFGRRVEIRRGVGVWIWDGGGPSRLGCLSKNLGQFLKHSTCLEAVGQVRSPALLTLQPHFQN